MTTFNSGLNLWETDPAFLAAFHEIEERSLVDQVRCYMLWQFAKQVRPLGGSVIEVGVYKGGSAKLIGGVLCDREIFLCDTFNGMPPCDPERDTHQEGDFSDTSAEAVWKFLKGERQPVIVSGIFPGSAKGRIHDSYQFCLAHIDVDIYKSAKESCEFLYPRMVKGGVMIFDDYGFVSCNGAKVACDEFFQDKKETLIYLPTGQALVIKL